LERCEQVISEGLAEVHDREGLWIVSANLQKYLGNKPAAIEYLKRAGTNKIAKYLLAKIFLKENNPQKAIEVLEPIIKSDPNEWRPAVLYAIAQIQSGAAYKVALATLQLASLKGMNNPKYLATYGGLQFLDRSFTEAERTFRDSVAKNFPINDLHGIHFVPTNLNQPVVIQGEIESVKPGYLWIAVLGYPSIFCPRSSLKVRNPSKGLKIWFQLGFSARGQIAIFPQPVAPTARLQPAFQKAIRDSIDRG